MSVYTSKITLGGKEYTLYALPIQKARDFRKRLSAPFDKVIADLQGAQSVELKDFAGLGGLVNTFTSSLIGVVDKCFEFLLEYSPEVAADRKRIEAEAYDEEVVTAFIEVLKILYPFGGLARKAFSNLVGLVASATMKNSPSANTDSGQTSSTEKS